MDFYEIVLTYIVPALSIIATAVSLFIAFVKAKKDGNSNGVVKLLKKIPELVVTAEALFGKGKGYAKLDYVLKELRIIALEQSIKIDEVELINQINSVVDATKNVNVEKVPSETITTQENTTECVMADSNLNCENNTTNSNKEIENVNI